MDSGFTSDMVTFEKNDLSGIPGLSEQQVLDTYNTLNGLSKGEIDRLWDIKTAEGLEEIIGFKPSRKQLEGLDCYNGLLRDSVEDYIRGMFHSAKGLGIAKKLGLRLNAPLEEMLMDFFDLAIGHRKYIDQLEDYFEHGKCHNAYFGLITKRYGEPGIEQILDWAKKIRPEDFKLGEKDENSEIYLKAAWPHYTNEILKSELETRLSKNLFDRFTSFFDRIHYDIEDLEKERAFLDNLAKFSITEEPELLARIHTGLDIEDICFTDLGDLATICSDFEKGRLKISLYSQDGSELSSYLIKNIRPEFGRNAQINRWNGKLVAVIQGKALLFDNELNILEKEETSSSKYIVRTDVLEKTRDLEELIKYKELMSLQSIRTAEGEKSYALLCEKAYSWPETTWLVRGDGKRLKIGFNSSGSWPLKSMSPSLAALPEGDLLVYSGDFYRVDKDMVEIERFYIPYTLDSSIIAGTSNFSNSKLSTDPLGRLYIINKFFNLVSDMGKGKEARRAEIKTDKNPEHAYWSDFPHTSQEIEPTPNLRVFRLQSNNIGYLTTIPLTMAGNIDCFSATAVDDNPQSPGYLRFAVTRSRDIEIYAPIKEKLSLAGNNAKQLISE